MATVLVVDDSANNRALMSRILESHDHHIIEATNGAEALGLARVRRPDVVITDVLMPKVDGYELERELRADAATASIPVVFHTSAYSSEEVGEMVRESPRLRILPKPTDVGRILEMVASVVREGPCTDEAPVADEHQEHLAALNAKLLQTVRELELAGLERQRLLAYLIQAQEDERAVIAGDIHDDSVQAMTAVAMRLEMFGRGLTDPVMVERHQKLEETVRLAIGRLRRLLFQLHPPALERDGLASTIRAYLEQAFQPGVCEHVVTDEMNQEPAVPVRVLLYRVAQEALVNIAKHADARTIRVEFASVDDGVRVAVHDDGRGFEPAEEDVNRPGHMGLSSMRQRVQLAGGRWQLESQPGRGTSVTVWVPSSLMDPAR